MRNVVILVASVSTMAICVNPIFQIFFVSLASMNVAAGPDA
jgi:hypothetical protein